jgi:cytosine/uracil/thiamine/allantoin permease
LRTIGNDEDHIHVRGNIDIVAGRRDAVDNGEISRGETSAYGDINWSGIIAFFAGLIAGWSMEDGLVPALQGPISGLLGGADLSWLFGIVIAGAMYLVLSRRVAVAPSIVTTG